MDPRCHQESGPDTTELAGTGECAGRCKHVHTVRDCALQSMQGCLSCGGRKS